MNIYKLKNLNCSESKRIELIDSIIKLYKEILQHGNTDDINSLIDEIFDTKLNEISINCNTEDIDSIKSQVKETMRMINYQLLQNNQNTLSV